MPSQAFVTIFFQNPCSYTEHSKVEYGKKSEKKCIFPYPPPLYDMYILVCKEIHDMTKRLYAPILIALVAATAAILSGCSCDGCTTDTCSDVTHEKWHLFDFQKEKYFFGQPKSARYSHSSGFEVEMKRTTDSTYKEFYTDFCFEALQETRLLKYTSTYPIMEIEVLLGADKYLGSVHIDFADNRFGFWTDSTGKIENPHEILDTASFNGILYDSVYVIHGYKFTTWEQNRFEAEQTGKVPYAYVSRTKGILRIQTSDGDTLTLIGSEDTHE